MIQLNNREKRFIIIGIIIIVVSLAYARFFYPMYITINALVDEFREKQNIIFCPSISGFPASLKIL